MLSLHRLGLGAGRRLLPALAVLVLLPTPALAQQVVTGRAVAAASGRPLAGVAVRISGGELPQPVTVTTDADGRFIFPSVAAGRYHMVATLRGYLDAEADFQLRPRQSRSVDLVLRVAQAASNVVVRAPLIVDATNYSSNIEVQQETVEELPMARTENWSEVITTLYSGAVAGHDDLVHLRGNELSMNYFINGVSFLDNTHKQFSPALSPRVFESVNVVTGGFSAEYGDRFGGILDMTTKSGFAQGGHGSAAISGGTLERGNAAVEYGDRAGSWGYYANGSFLTDGRFLNTPEPATTNNTGRALRGMLELDYKPAGASSLKVVASGGGTDFDLPTTEEQRAAGRDASKVNRLQTLIATWNRTIGDDGLLAVSGYQRSARETVIPTSDPITTFADGRRGTLTAGAKADFTHGFAGAGGHVLKAGIDVKGLRLDERLAVDAREEEDEHVDEELFGELRPRRAGRFVAEHSAVSEALEVFSFADRHNGSLLGAYVQDELQPLDRLTLDVGVRVDRFAVLDSFTQAAPRVNLAYAIGDSVAVHAAYNRFFAVPPIEWLLLASTGVDEALPVHPMVSDHYEAGVHADLGGYAEASANAYYRDDENPFETTEILDTNVFTPTNFARGDSRGLELILRVDEIEPAGLSGFLSYSLSRTNFYGPVSGGLPGEELEPGEEVLPAFDQKHTLAAGATWRERRSGLRAGLGFEYGSGNAVEAAEEGGGLTRLPSHLVVGLSLGIDVLRSSSHPVALQLNVENLTDELVPIAKESALTPVQYATPRSFSLQARIGF